MLLEEIEDFALEDMGKSVYYLDAQSPLWQVLKTWSSIRLTATTEKMTNRCCNSTIIIDILFTIIRIST